MEHWGEGKQTFFLWALCILANFQISQKGTNERKMFKKKEFPNFLYKYTLLQTDFYKKRRHMINHTLFCFKKKDVPPKEVHLVSMLMHSPKYRLS